MPFATKQITISTATKEGSAIIMAEKGSIVGVSLLCSVDTTGPNQAYGVIFLASTETPTPALICQLAAGYIGSNFGVSWTGHIVADPTFALKGYCYGDQDSKPYNFLVVTEV